MVGNLKELLEVIIHLSKLSEFNFRGFKDVQIEKLNDTIDKLKKILEENRLMRESFGKGMVNRASELKIITIIKKIRVVREDFR